MPAHRSPALLPTVLILLALCVPGCVSDPTEEPAAKPETGPPPRTEIERAAQRLRPITRAQIESLAIGMAWGDVQMELRQPDFLNTNVGPYLHAKEGGIYWLQFEGGGIWLTRATYFPPGLKSGEVVLPVAERGKVVKVESIGTEKPSK